MATRLANIRLITKNARERQSVFNAEHRRKVSTRPTKYRERANAIMECGMLKRFVGNLTERYVDYLNFHQENLNELSPLIIAVPPLCPPLRALSPCLFGPPRRDDYNEVINSNLSWSQFAAPVPAGWRERFFQDRLWEYHIERRAFYEYSDKEREAEDTALEYQRRQLGAILQNTSNSPPPLQRKCPVPLPSATSSPLLLGVLPSEESEPLNCENWATCDPPSGGSADLVPSPSKTPPQIEIVNTVAPSGKQPAPVRSTPKPSQSCRLLRRHSQLHITIPETERVIPRLDQHFDSPLSGTGMDIPLPSVLLNALAVRAYLDSIHGPHLELPQHDSSQEAYPQSPQHQFIPSKLVMEAPAQRMLVENMKCYDTREASLVVAADVQSDMRRSRLSAPRTYTNKPRPLYALKRRSSQSSIVASNKKPRLMAPIPTKNLS